MHDIADLELRGVPGVFVASDEFLTAADSQQASLGFPSMKRVFCAHPIQDRTDDEMRTLAEQVFAEILSGITE